MKDNLLVYKKIIKTVPIEKKVTGIDKKGKEIIKTISYTLQFIVSARFMANSLSSLINNAAGRICKIKCQYGHDNEKSESCGKDLLIHTNIIAMILISLFYCCKNVLTLMNTWTIEKNLMKHHYQRKKIVLVIQTWKTLLIQITQKQCAKGLKKNISVNIIICMFKVMHYC